MLKPFLKHSLTLFVFMTCGPIVKAQTCPDYGSSTHLAKAPSHATIATDYTTVPIQFSFDDGSSVLNGESQMLGAQAAQGDRTISADVLHYDAATKKIKAAGNVAFEDVQLRISGKDADMDAIGGVTFTDANFMLKTRAGRGSASRIQLTPQGNLALAEVSYTTCPPSKPDWLLKLSALDINQTTRTGTGRNVRLEFKGVPVFYMPWISFPVGDERKSGFLFPNVRTSSLGGYSLLVPWYWNLAPNYDATLTPIIDSLRGAELDSELRYLTAKSKGTLLADYLPYDPTQHAWRGLAQLKHLTDFNSSLRLQLDAGSVTDNKWFEDFGQNRDETSRVYLARSLLLSAFSSNWRGSVAVQNLQTLDDSISLNSRPYTALPQLAVVGHETRLPLGFDFDFAGELSYFTRSDSNTNATDSVSTGARLFAAPTISLPLRTAGMYVIPSTGWRYTAYQLQHTDIGQDRSPSLSAPVSSVDIGMNFERLATGDQHIYTLQPRVLYVYTPLRNQAALPLFDTGLPDFNLVQLFRVDRFVGPDRLGDANQVSTGITARMLDAHSGRQYLSGTLGQAFYLKTPCITSVTSVDTATCAANPNAAHSSPMIAQVALSAYKNWNASMGLQWDPQQEHNERSEINFQYKPAHDRVLNLSYRFTRNTSVNSQCTGNIPTNPATPQRYCVDQVESSFAWPVGAYWSTYGRVIYSRLDNALHDYLGGVEYRSCCWNVRLVFGRSITTREGTYDTRLNLQFELKGLGSVGTADASLQGAIPGYSARAATN